MTEPNLTTIVSDLLFAWDDHAKHYSCAEAELMYRLIHVLHSRDAAEHFMRSHALSDSEDEGDDHVGYGQEDM